MKINRLYKITALIATLVTLAVASANALTDAQVASVKKAFNNVPVPEIAAKAAKLVAQAPASDKQEIAVLIIKTVAASNPAVLVSVVSSISAVAPEIAPAVSASAASLASDYVEAITIAAVKAAPRYAQQIGTSVSTSAPQAAAKVAETVRVTEKSASTPSASGGIRIVSGVGRGIVYTPPLAPSAAGTSTTGFDPNRYKVGN